MNRDALVTALGTSDIAFRGDTDWCLLSDMPADPDTPVPWKTVDDLTTEQRSAYDAALLSASVPAYVTKLGLKRACEQQTDWGGSGSNLWQIAKQAIAALGESEQDEWNLATQVPRENSAFVALATSPAIGATEEQIDNVFILAKTLE